MFTVFQVILLGTSSEAATRGVLYKKVLHTGVTYVLYRTPLDDFF